MFNMKTVLSTAHARLLSSISDANDLQPQTGLFHDSSPIKMWCSAPTYNLNFFVYIFY